MRGTTDLAGLSARVSSYGYDADGNQTTVQDARGYTTTTTYNADDEATLVTDPDGNATLTCYDGDGNVAQTVPPVGVAADDLAPSSCPTSYPSGYSDPLASDATVDTYDAAGDETASNSPAPAGHSGFETTTYTYDGDGNLLTTTAPPVSNGGSDQVTVDTYNDNGAVSSVTTGYGTVAASTISYCYDPNGDTTSMVYADGNTGVDYTSGTVTGLAACGTSSPWNVSATPQADYQTTYQYDSVGELVSTTTPATTAAPAGATRTATYDPDGNQLTSTDPDGVTTTLTYTPADQVASISYSGSSAHSVSYTYDADGDRTAMTDATGSSSFSYDSFGDLTSTTNGAGQTTGYGYNADGEVTSVSYPLPSSATWATSDTVDYSFDHADQLTGVTDFNGNTMSFGNTADGLPDSVSLGSTRDTISMTYDNADGPSEIKLADGSMTLQSFSYSDAPAGDILAETDTPSSSDSPASYTYDADGRVTSMTPGSGSALDYGFDASGNLTTLPTGASGSYDDSGELTSATLSGTTTNYTYSADGERLSAKQGGTTLASATWNGAGELSSYDDSAADMSAATYDGNGVRASATSGSTTQDFVWDDVSAAPELLMDSGNAYIYGAGPAPAEQVRLSTGTVTYLVSDAVGSVRGTVSSSGTLTGTTAYDAWGNPETSGGLTATTPFGLAGGYTDPDGLIYLINRYYDPATGQFLSVDPDLSETGEAYAYGGDDPVNQSDPNGLYSYHFCWTLGGRGSPKHVFWYFAHHMHRVFPFKTGKCWRLYLHEHCDFHPSPGSDNHLHVKAMGTTWATLEVNNWCQLKIIWICVAGDPPGSTIQFSVFDLPTSDFRGLHTRFGWEDILEQKAHSPKASFVTNMFAPSLAELTWYQQAINLSTLMGGGKADVYYISNMSSTTKT